MNTYESFWISCKDGYQLSARYYASENNTKQFPILVCPATGITQNFYNSFAQWLNQQGYQVLTFDSEELVSHTWQIKRFYSKY